MGRSAPGNVFRKRLPLPYGKAPPCRALPGRTPFFRRKRPLKKAKIPRAQSALFGFSGLFRLFLLPGKGDEFRAEG